MAHLVIADLSQHGEKCEHWRSCLSEPELMRGGRLRKVEDQHRFITGRGILRTLLGGSMQINPMQAPIEFNQYGKPMLPAHIPIKFNIAHSENIAVYALALEEVGVDIERVRDDFATAAHARQFMSGEELGAFEALDGRARPEYFFQIWTQKEAYLKGTGEGLLRPTDVTLPGAGSTLGGWSIQSISVHPAYCSAVALRSTQCAIRLWSFDAM